MLYRSNVWLPSRSFDPLHQLLAPYALNSRFMVRPWWGYERGEFIQTHSKKKSSLWGLFHKCEIMISKMFFPQQIETLWLISVSWVLVFTVMDSPRSRSSPTISLCALLLLCLLSSSKISCNYFSSLWQVIPCDLVNLWNKKKKSVNTNQAIISVWLYCDLTPFCLLWEGTGDSVAI